MDAKSHYFSTGIDELNDLLTRDPDHGFAIPGSGPVASCNVVFKGAAGNGKSVISSIIAFNLHLSRTKKKSEYLPLCFYFSFAQPARGLLNYIESIRLGKGIDETRGVDLNRSFLNRITCCK